MGPEPIRSGKFLVDGSPQGSKPSGDLISEGKLVVLPPTVHPDGFPRRWVVAPYRDLPTLNLSDLHVERHMATLAELSADPHAPLSEGMRHHTMLRLAIGLHKVGIHGQAMRDTLSAFNQARCKPPLPKAEVESVCQWIINRYSLREGSEEESLISIKLSPNHPIQHLTPDRNVLREEQRMKEMASAFQNAREYLTSAGEEPLEWIIEDMLPRGYLVVVGGTSKAGKSCFLTALSIAVAKGEPFLGYNVRQGAVLWCAYEESRGERAATLSAYEDVPDGLHITHCKPLIDTPEGLELLRFWVEQTKASVIVIDPLYGANSAESLTDGKSARNALQGLKDLCNDLNCSAIVIHHITKNVGAGMTRERFADTNQILATASMDILMDSSDEPDGTRLIRLQGRGRGSFANVTWLVESSGVTDYQLRACGTTAEIASLTDTDSLILNTLEEVGGGMTADEITSRLPVSLHTVRNTLTELVKSGRAAIQGKKGRSNLYIPAQPALA